MTIVARRIRATPARSAREAWAVMVDLLAPTSGGVARQELESIAGIAASLIADEALIAPVVVFGSGPRVRLYCLYNEDAISGEDANEQALAFDATSGEWQMSLPCPAVDLVWVQAALAAHTTHITARDIAASMEIPEPDAADGSVVKTGTHTLGSRIEVDREGFFRS